MKPNNTRDITQPFLLRVWQEEADGVVIWCGKLQHIVTGASHIFRGWPALVSLLEANLSVEKDDEVPAANINESSGFIDSEGSSEEVSKPVGMRKTSHSLYIT